MLNFRADNPKTKENVKVKSLLKTRVTELKTKAYQVHSEVS